MNDFFNLLGDFFQNRPLTNEEQILLGILALLIFTLGVIVGWIVQGSKTRRYRKELLLLRKDRDEYEVRYRATETKQKALAKELEAVSREKVDALDRAQGLERELTQRDASLLQLQREKEELNASNQSYAATIEALNDQVIGLKTQNEQLLIDKGNTPTPRGMEDTSTAPSAASNESLNAYILASESRFQHLEQRLASLTVENAELRSTAPPSGPYTPHQPVVDPSLSMGTASATNTGEPLVIRADTTEPGVRTGHQGEAEVIIQKTPSVHIPVIAGEDVHRDDLTKISNIGPFLQTKLNEADIYSYEQIAAWSEADIVTYTGLIGYIPGIIQRDDWVGQAKALAENPYHAEEVVDAPVVAETLEEVVEESFKVIEGIGPKIESVLKASGILSLNQLAETPADRLREILEEAGSRFKSHDPKTWPVQAGLAADGKLKELKAWQK
ncbi:MAG: helix-hairpin-helix domain-containing protein, partial [Bacteroidota bacterium]